MAELYILEFPNGKGYVGMTSKTTEYRLRQHLAEARLGHSTAVVHRAIRKHGTPVSHVIAIGPREQILRNEVTLIATLGTMTPNGYNRSPGGGAPPTMTDEIRQHMSRAATGRKHTAATKQKMSESRTGHETSQETRDKMSAAMRGRKHSIEHNEKIAAAMRGRKASEETKRKMREAQQRRRERERGE